MVPLATPTTAAALHTEAGRPSTRLAARLAALPQRRELELRPAFAFAPTGELPVTVLYFFTHPPPARAANWEAGLAQVVGTAPSSECSSCAREAGPFTTCQVVEGELRGSCANCHYGSEGSRCSLRPGMCSLTALFFLLTLLQLPPAARSASAAQPVLPRLRQPLLPSPPLARPVKVCPTPVTSSYRPVKDFTGIRAALRKAREVVAALEALEEVLENDP